MTIGSEAPLWRQDMTLSTVTHEGAPSSNRIQSDSMVPWLTLPPCAIGG